MLINKEFDKSHLPAANCRGWLWGLLLAALPAVAAGQEISGHWVGYLTQSGKTDTFRYELYLSREGDAVSGLSRSVDPEGALAEFSVSGVWKDGQLKLQEVAQLKPEAPRWCRKFAVLKLDRSQYRWRFRGSWQADGCRPGEIALQLESFTGQEQAPLTFSRTGAWKGVLQQSDREYGFYFELHLAEEGRGSSYIVSEGNGGWARHALAWHWTAEDSSIHFQEAAVSEKSDAQWPWCIKKGRLRMRRASGKYLLEGPWQGYIEGHSPQRGACAPGRLRLEKPMLTQAASRQMAEKAAAYQSKARRSVNVQRILDVRAQTIRLKVWDNGITDGDVLSLFLNGRQILDEYRVNKQRYAIPVELQRGENMLVLHAIDLGNITPNTVAVAVDDGHQEQTIILSSNLDESGSVMIRYFEFR